MAQVYRYKSRANRFVDVELSPDDKPRIDRLLGVHGFVFLEVDPTTKVDRVSFEEFSRMMNPRAPEPGQLSGPQPGGGYGPIYNQAAPGTVTIPIG